MTDPQFQLDFDTPEVAQSILPTAKPRRHSRKVVSAKPGAEMTPQMMADTLAQNPDYRVLRRLVPVHYFDRVAQGPVVRVVVLDTETTGLDHACDKIIELAMLRVDVDATTGLPVGEVEVYDALEDPGLPISAEVQAITGISNDMVRGRQLDESRIATMLQGVDLVIAHNAAFDRPFCEARMPAFAHLPWGCSFVEIDWKKEGYGSAKLEYLAWENGWFYDAHRAEVDCHALLAVLSSQLRTEQGTGLTKIIHSSRSPSFRLNATQAPFDAKDLLKSRAYRWDAELRVWYRRLFDEAQLNSEFQWLKTHVYGNRSACVQLERIEAAQKYSKRPGELSISHI